MAMFDIITMFDRDGRHPAEIVRDALTEAANGEPLDLCLFR